MAGIVYALDIGHSSIKVIKYRPQWRGPEVIDARLDHLPLNLSGISSEDEKIALWKQALSTSLQQEKEKKPKRVIVSLPSDVTFVRYITLPNIPIAKISKIIRFEAEQQIPFLLSDVEWSYDVLPSRRKKEVDIVITAAKKKFIKDLIELLSSLRFRIESFETAQLVLSNLARFYELDKEGGIIVDIGARTTEVVIIYKDMSWGRTLRHGTFTITSRIAKELGIDLKDAERLKQEHAKTGRILGASGSEKDSIVGAPYAVENVIRDVLYDIVNEVSRTMSYYLSVFRGAVFRHIILTGGGSYIKNIEDFFHKNLGIKTTIADFTTRLRLSSYLTDRLRFDRNFYHIAAGLAFHYQFRQRLSANLISERLREKRLVAKQRGRFHFFFILIILIFATGIINFQLELLVKQKKEHAFNNQLAHIDRKEEQLRTLTNTIKQRKGKLQLLSERMRHQAFLLQLLYDIEGILPDTIWFDFWEYDADSNALVISGRTSETLAEINKFTQDVRLLVYVKEVTFQTAAIEEKPLPAAPQRLFTINVSLIEHEEGS